MSKRRKEMLEKRHKRKEKHSQKDYAQPMPRSWRVPEGAILADMSKQAPGGLSERRYYIDTEFACRDCGKVEIWTAKEQQWYYEVIKANIKSEAVRCAECRKKRRVTKAEQKRHMEDLKAAEDGTET